MLTIPTDLNTWHPNEIGEWLAGLDGDQGVTDDEYAQAQRAVSAALLGEDLAADIHDA